MSGSLLLVPAGSPAPVNYTLVGHYTLPSLSGIKKADLVIDVFRRN